MFGPGKITLSHPSFLMVSSEKEIERMAAELRSKPDSFQFCSRTTVWQDSKAGDPVLACRFKPGILELLVSWGTRSRSLYHVTLPPDRGTPKSMPLLGDLPIYAEYGFMLAFKHPSADDLKTGRVLDVKISLLSRDFGATERLETFSITVDPRNGWSVQPGEFNEIPSRLRPGTPEDISDLNLPTLPNKEAAQDGSRDESWDLDDSNPPPGGPPTNPA